MNSHQLAVLAREIVHFCASVTHLAATLHNEKREAHPDELSPLVSHDSRVALALSGLDPNTVDAPTLESLDRTRQTATADQTKQLNETLDALNAMRGEIS